MSANFMGGVVVLSAVATGTVGAAGMTSAAAIPVHDGQGEHGHGHSKHGDATAPERVLSNSALVRASKELVELARRHGDQPVTMIIMERAGTIRLVVRTRKTGP